MSLDVSVVAANYNNAAFLHEFFNSWINSSSSPKELIFVDDGSKDNSLQIARSYQAQLPNLIVVELGKNKGFGNALNAGIKLASCKYILRIDPDDVVMPERLTKQVSVLDSGEADVVGSNAIIFQSGSGATMGMTNFPRDHIEIEKTIRRGEHGVLHPTVLARAELFKSHPYIQDNVPAEDYDIFARMLRAGARFHNIQEPLLRYRIHQRSASNVLPFDTIKKTYRIRDAVFETETRKVTVFLYYAHIKLYRKFLFSKNKINRLFYLGAASILRPDKAAKRVLRILGSSLVDHQA